MQLSSLFLSATALLAQAASADYLLFPTNEDFQAYGPARIASTEALANVGFYSDPVGASEPLKELASIHVDEKRDIGNRFLLREAGPGKWALLSKGNSSVSEMTDITKPFGTHTDKGFKLFVYEGQEKLDWVLCKVDDLDGERDIYLVDGSVPVGTDCAKSGLSAIEY